MSPAVQSNTILALHGKRTDLGLCVLPCHFLHVYFTGADEPYEKLRRALKAEIGATLYSTISRPSSIPPLAKSPSKSSTTTGMRC